MANENLSGAPEEKNRELSQTEGNSVEWDSIINGQTAPKPATSFNVTSAQRSPAPVVDEEDYPDFENVYNDAPINEQPFYFDPDEQDDFSNNIMQDPTDFTDVAADAKRRRNFKIYGLSALVIVALVSGGFFGIKGFMASQEAEQKSAEQVNTQVEEQTSVDAPKKPEMPLLKLVSDAPTVTDKESSVTVVGSTLVTSENISLSVRNSDLVEVQNGCTVALTTDFCLAARGTDSVDKKKTTDVYYFKDAAHSRVFEDPTNFKPVTVTGSPASAVMEIKLVAGKPTPVIVVVAPNSSGFMIALPQGTSIEEAAGFAETLALS